MGVLGGEREWEGPSTRHNVQLASQEVNALFTPQKQNGEYLSTLTVVRKVNAVIREASIQGDYLQSRSERVGVARCRFESATKYIPHNFRACVSRSRTF